MIPGGTTVHGRENHRCLGTLPCLRLPHVLCPGEQSSSCGMKVVLVQMSLEGRRDVLRVHVHLRQACCLVGFTAGRVFAVF